MKNICVFGASTTSGLFDYENGGWCDLLKRYLMSKGFSVFNLGVSGNDTSDLLKRFKNECSVRTPDWIILALGSNDTQYLMDKNAFRVDINTTISNFLELFRIARKFTSNVIVVGLTKVDEDKINSYYIPRKHMFHKNKILKKYDMAIEKISKKNDIQFIQTFNLLNKSDLEDGVHPNAKGHKKLYNKIRNDVVKYMKLD
jgi:lysophospholipase L1-like esterase